MAPNSQHQPQHQSRQPGRIAVIGAGMAGLACAQALQAGGAVVTIFDKGRRPGGRLATRRQGAVMFDHGAQYATAKGEPFQRFLAEAAAQPTPLVAPWDAAETRPRWVGVPGMSAFARAAERHGVGSLVLGRQVMAIARTEPGWLLRHLDASQTRPGSVADTGELAGPFERIVLALPPAQAAALLAGFGHGLATRVAAIRMEPCWALMLAFAERQPGADRRSGEDGATLSWIARNSSRPGHAELPDSWVGHASGDWSRARLDDTAEQVLPALHRAFREATGITAAPILAAVHRWRFARTETPLGEPVLWDPAGLAVCGDWCLGARVEAAFESGLAAAAACL